jgi:hypothetical protein
MHDPSATGFGWVCTATQKASSNLFHGINDGKLARNRTLRILGSLPLPATKVVRKVPQYNVIGLQS